MGAAKWDWLQTKGHRSVWIMHKCFQLRCRVISKVSEFHSASNPARVTQSPERALSLSEVCAVSLISCTEYSHIKLPSERRHERVKRSRWKRQRAPQPRFHRPLNIYTDKQHWCTSQGGEVLLLKLQEVYLIRWWITHWWAVHQIIRFVYLISHELINQSHTFPETFHWLKASV